MYKIKNNIFLSVSFLVLSFVLFGWMIIQNKTVLFRTYNPGEAEKTYGQSQWQQSQNVAPDKARDEWAIQNKYTGWSDYVVANKDKVDIKKLSDQILASIGKKVVSDSFLYSYVGYKYINGTDPSLLNPEHPPLAKVLIGYSIKTFGNEHIIGIIIACITLILVGAISYQIYRSLLAASFAVFLTSFFSLFSDQIAHGPQLELYQLFFFLLVAQFLLMWKRKKNIIFCIGSGIFFGMLLSTKTFLPFFLLFSVWLIVALWKQWKALFIIFLFGAISFCLTYYSYFAHGGTLRTFLGLQKYIVTFYGHSSIPFFEFLGNNLRLIFTGSWKFWDTARSVSTYSEWNLLWPIIFLIGMYKLKIQWTKYNNSHILIWFVILYNIFVFVIPIFPRYLLLLFVPLIILI